MGGNEGIMRITCDVEDLQLDNKGQSSCPPAEAGRLEGFVFPFLTLIFNYQKCYILYICMYIYVEKTTN
jgi:hypothetical protein